MFAVAYILAVLAVACIVAGPISALLPEAFWDAVGLGDTTERSNR